MMTLKNMRSAVHAVGPWKGQKCDISITRTVSSTWHVSAVTDDNDATKSVPAIHPKSLRNNNKNDNVLKILFYYVGSFCRVWCDFVKL